MLGSWRKHKDYITNLITGITEHYKHDPEGVLRHEKAIAKALLLDLDDAMNEISCAYPTIGAPARDQPELLRSIIIMSEYHIESPSVWRNMLELDPVLRLVVGLPKDMLHSVGSYYDFIDRLWGNPHIHKKNEKSKPLSELRKPKVKPKPGEKLPPRHPEIIERLVDKFLEGRTFEHRPERLMQLLFAKAAMEPAVVEGLYGDVYKMPISGDGTCIGTGGASRGIRVCSCKTNGIYNCKCPRRYSDYEARWGFNSYTNSYFYGHSLYCLTHHNPELKTDLPVLLRMVEAQRYDGVSAIVAISEFYDIYRNYKIGVFIGDCAHDNISTYRLLKKINIDAVITLNKRTKNFIDGVKVDDDGVPLCADGRRMANWGYDKRRNRTKYRCPCAARKNVSCTLWGQCAKSDYGKSVYMSPGTDLRLFTTPPRLGDEWKRLMNTRTASERFNKRNSLDYPLAHTRIRGKKRIFMRIVSNAINIVLDARLKKNHPDIVGLLLDSALA